MAELPWPTAPEFSLGSTSKLQDRDDTTIIATSSINGLPSRPKVNMQTTTDAKLPPSDRTLTGKQEHCEWASNNGRSWWKPNCPKILSENSFRSKSYSKSQT